MYNLGHALQSVVSNLKEIIMYIAIQGNPVDGFDYFGPFNTAVEAMEYIQADYDVSDWWIKELTNPTNPNETHTA